MSDYAARAQSRSERALAVFLVAAAIFALVAAAVLLVPSALRITRYEISGNASMTREDVLSAALIHDTEYFFSLDAARVKAALIADPRVASVSVSKLFPNGLRIAVAERKSVAAVIVTIGGVDSAVCLDSEGVAFAEASPEAAVSVPLISGIRFEGFRLGMRLPPALTVLVASLGEIQSSEPALLSAISEIRIVKPASGSSSAGAAPELVIYPLNQRIPVRAGASLDAPTLRSIILVLDVLGTKGLSSSVQEIDFRTGTVVYRSKEGQSG
jgi:cell division protein FtsQ